MHSSCASHWIGPARSASECVARAELLLRGSRQLLWPEGRDAVGHDHRFGHKLNLGRLQAVSRLAVTVIVPGARVDRTATRLIPHSVFR